MANVYKKLDSITSSRTDKSGRIEINSVIYWSKEHYIEFKKQKKVLEKNTITNLENMYDKVLKMCKENDKILKRKIYHLIQCDPSQENIFIMKQGIKFIDWDFAGYHLFERDLILFSDIYNLNKKQELLFLRCYGIDPNDKFMKKWRITKLLLFLGDINWILSQKEKNHKKIKTILKKCFSILKKLEIHSVTKRMN